MKRTILASSIVLLLAARAMAAPVVSPATGPLKATVVASASINADLTILRQDGNWINKISYGEFIGGTPYVPYGIQLIISMNPVFTSPPTCVATLALSDASPLFSDHSPFQAINVSSADTQFVTVETPVITTEIPPETYLNSGYPFNIICEGDLQLSIPVAPGHHLPPGLD